MPDPAPTSPSAPPPPEPIAPVAPDRGPLAEGAVEGLDESFDIVEPLCAVFRRALKDAGLKYTPERAQVLDAIIRIDAPFDAERIIADLKRARFRVSKATIYRTLKLMQDAGILHRPPFHGDNPPYELLYGRSPRHTILRLDDATSSSIDLPELDAIVRKACAQRGLMMLGCRLHVLATGTPTKGD